MHDISLITTIAAGFTGAWVFGLLSQRLGLSPIVGYLLAGVIIGPYTPGYVGDTHIAQQLAEVGVMLLMFGVGLHFHLKDLVAVRNVAIPGAVVQSLAATIFAVLIFSLFFGFSVKSAAVLGMAMAVASTVVLIRVLQDANVLNSTQGHVAVGWLIVEDIFTVILLVLIPVLGEQAISTAAVAAETPASTPAPAFWTTLGLALLKLGVFVALLLVVGARVVPWALVRVAKLRSRELFTLTVLVFSIAIATAAYSIFGASVALGAFLAGMVVAQSPVSHQAAADALPMRDAFAVLFFVSVGMLFDPTILYREPLMVLAALGIILIAKPLAALFIVAVLGHSVRTALTVAIGLAQIGEFSFILSDLAMRHNLMPGEGHSVLVGSAIISITLNPLLFRSLPRIENALRARPALWRILNGRAESKARQTNTAAAERVDSLAQSAARLAIVVGYGPVGRSVDRLLRDAGLPTVVIDINMETVSTLNAEGRTAIYGDASHESILEQAGVQDASHVVITLPDASDRAAVVAAVRNLNPTTRILVRARYLREREDLEHAGATVAVFEEAEAAIALARVVLADTGIHREAAERKVRDLRFNLINENMSNIRTQRVSSVMVPWTRVRRLSTSASRDEVLRQIASHRFSRWPVVDPHGGRAVGYLLAKDLISADPSSAEEWTSLVRPLAAISPENAVESTLARMQSESATVYLVEDAGSPVGLVTLEDILEQVVGRIEDEYPHEARISLASAVANGGVLLSLRAGTRDEAIAELAEAIPHGVLPPGTRIADLAIAREAELSTDLGCGVAVPHARCPGLQAPIIVFGRLADGVMFSSHSAEPVRLIFLLVTPTEQPELQLSLLAQIAAIAGDASKRDRLRHASSLADIMDILGH